MREGQCDVVARAGSNRRPADVQLADCCVLGCCQSSALDGGSVKASDQGSVPLTALRTRRPGRPGRPSEKGDIWSRMTRSAACPRGRLAALLSQPLSVRSTPRRR
jgi:hypothetical protein